MSFIKKHRLIIAYGFILLLTIILMVFLIVSFDQSLKFLSLFILTIVNVFIGVLLYDYKHKESNYEKMDQKFLDSLKSLVEDEYIKIDEVDKESIEFNQVLSVLHEKIQGYEQVYDQLSSILDALKQAVLLFNNESKLLYMNQDARTIFSLDEKDMHQEAFYIFRNKKIQDAILETNKNRMVYTFDLTSKNRIFLVNVLPTLKRPTNLKDPSVLVVLKNVSDIRLVEQVKKDFFAHASHELKSPITAIRGYGELIENEMLSPSEIIETGSFIAKQATHMTLLVEDMLTLSRLETVEVKQYENQNMRDLLDQAIESLKQELSDKAIDLVYEKKAISYKAEALDMIKLFRNLIENAIKYSYDGGKIIIDVYQTETHFVFNVEDFGIGIDPLHHERIFERFYRVDKGRFDGGTGLGLAIVKHIVLKYKGQINLKSDLNEGTKMQILLPL